MYGKGVNMEKRKIQRTGSSSYIITLPKEWIDSMGLKSGDYVYVYEYNDKLIITSSKAESRKLKGEIRILKPVENDEVFRILVGMYLSGYDNIVVYYNPSIPGLAKRINELKNYARIKLAGVEIVDETFNSITLKILLNFKELPLIHAIKRLHLIVSNMLRDALSAFHEKNLERAETVIQRDDESDRFHFMINRQLAQALLDISIMRELGIENPVEILNYRIIARNLERIADHAVNIARRTFYREEECVLCDEVYRLGLRIVDLFNKSMDCLYKLSRTICEDVIREAREIVGFIETMLTEKILSGNISSSEKALLTITFDSLRRITRYSNGIAEAALNIRVGKNPINEIK